MNEKKLEALSALMDGENHDLDARVLGEWTGDEGLRAAWGRYHLISECLRGTLPRHMDPALAQRVALAVRQEPAHAAGDALATRPWLRPVAGMAIAASVAALAVMGIQVNRQESGAGASVASITPDVTRASGGQLNLAAGETPARQRRAEAVDPRLNRYLINYTEQRGGAAAQGVPPRVRVMATGQEPGPQQ